MRAFNRSRQPRLEHSNSQDLSIRPPSGSGRLPAWPKLAWAAFSVVALAALALTLGMAHRRNFAAPLPQGFQPSFRDIVGSNGGFNPDLMKELKIGYIRRGFDWEGVEPAQGRWNWKDTDATVLGAQAQSIGVLPMLGFTAHWASSVRGAGFAPPRNQSDWTNYVNAVVSRYSAPPFNVRFFQIWNEPTKDAGFWQATDQQYIDMIYIPAAKIIREHNCMVVFGGWGQGDGIPRYNQLLNYHNAWQWTDILDIHYYPISAMQGLYAQWIATRKCKGIWQTEVGNVNNPVQLTNLYTNLFNWAKTSGNWTFPDQYKLFWYNGLGAGCSVCLAKIGPDGKTQSLTANGEALAKLAQSMP